MLGKKWEFPWKKSGNFLGKKAGNSWAKWESPWKSGHFLEKQEFPGKKSGNFLGKKSGNFQEKWELFPTLAAGVSFWLWLCRSFLSSTSLASSSLSSSCSCLIRRSLCSGLRWGHKNHRKMGKMGLISHSHCLGLPWNSRKTQKNGNKIQERETW